MTESKKPAGRVVAVRGAVIDIAFEPAELPRLDEALVVEWDQPETLIVEVQAHLDERTVRGVALQATAGLRRGVPVRASGNPVTVPVGDAVLGRLLDVTGAARDGRPPLPSDMPRVPIHRAARVFPGTLRETQCRRHRARLRRPTTAARLLCPGVVPRGRGAASDSLDPARFTKPEAPRPAMLLRTRCGHGTFKAQRLCS